MQQQTLNLKLYNLFRTKLNLSEPDAQEIVQSIENIFDYRFDKEKDMLSTKNGISLLRQDILKLHADMERRFNNIIMWLVGTGVGIVGLIFTVIKLFIVK